MKNKIVPIGLFTVFFLLIVAFIYFKPVAAPSRPIVQSVDEKGIYIGKGKSGLEPVSEEADQFAKTVKALHEGWDNIGAGETYYRAGRHEDALIAFKKAYEIDPGNRLMSGKKLIATYEAMHQFDKALEIVEEILKKESLGEYGVEKYTAIRSRLLAAKANADRQ